MNECNAITLSGKLDARQMGVFEAELLTSGSKLVLAIAVQAPLQYAAHLDNPMQASPGNLAARPASETLHGQRRCPASQVLDCRQASAWTERVVMEAAFRQGHVMSQRT